MVMPQENMPPVKPTMSGNVQTIFYMLLVGLLVAKSCLVLELHGYIFKKLEAAVYFCGFGLVTIVQMCKGFVKRRRK